MARRAQRKMLGILVLLLASPRCVRAQSDLQWFLNNLMGGRAGAVVVSNPATGQVLAVWNSHAAFTQPLPPGSAAKLVASAAALEEGVASPREQIFCRRVPELLGEAYHCSHPPSAGPFTLASALANSCNYFFVQLSLRLSSAALEHWYAVFGFGSPGEVRVGSEPRAKALAALGEETVTSTPEQLLLAYSAVAMGGKVFRLSRSAGRLEHPALLRTVRLQSRTLAVLRAGLEECVQSGTCQAAGVPGMRVAGKTGTASALDGSGKTHAWFVGYAPVESPAVALVVFLERGTGTHDAAPVAGRILHHFFEEKP